MYIIGDMIVQQLNNSVNYKDFSVIHFDFLANNFVYTPSKTIRH